MSFGGDNPRKVQNIIEHRLDGFRNLYSTFLGGLDYVLSVGFHPKMQQFVDPSVRGRIVRDLPSAFRAKLYSRYQKTYPSVLAAQRSDLDRV